MFRFFALWMGLLAFCFFLSAFVIVPMIHALVTTRGY